MLEEKHGFVEVHLKSECQKMSNEWHFKIGKNELAAIMTFYKTAGVIKIRDCHKNSSIRKSELHHQRGYICMFVIHSNQ